MNHFEYEKKYFLKVLKAVQFSLGINWDYVPEPSLTENTVF
jgi:hypothetical protein